CRSVPSWWIPDCGLPLPTVIPPPAAKRKGLPAANSPATSLPGPPRPLRLPQPGSILSGVQRVVRDWLKTEDWWAVWIGLTLFALSQGVLVGYDLLGWGVATSEWTDVTKAVGPSGDYTGLPGGVSLLLTYLFLLPILGVGAYALRLDRWRFAVGFTVAARVR